jgi:hypothetical protein
MESVPLIWELVASTGAYWMLLLYVEKDNRVSVLVSSIEAGLAYNCDNIVLSEIGDVIEPVSMLRQEYGMTKEIARWTTMCLMSYLALK